MPQSFGHVFAGGYAAGYYSYKWAEVLASDAFSAFEEGEFAPEIGRRFRDTVLALGGSRDAMDVFVDFRGRKPTIDALLRHIGLGSLDSQ
jgi:oligopeptidase A